MTVILKSDECETLTMYIQDFLQRYKSKKELIESRDECLKFIRETLPKVT